MDLSPQERNTKTFNRFKDLPPELREMTVLYSINPPQRITLLPQTLNNIPALTTNLPPWPQLHASRELRRIVQHHYKPLTCRSIPSAPALYIDFDKTVVALGDYQEAFLDVLRAYSVHQHLRSTKLTLRAMEMMYYVHIRHARRFLAMCPRLEMVEIMNLCLEEQVPLFRRTARLWEDRWERLHGVKARGVAGVRVWEEWWGRVRGVEGGRGEVVYRAVGVRSESLTRLEEYLQEKSERLVERVVEVDENGDAKME